MLFRSSRMMPMLAAVGTAPPPAQGVPQFVLVGEAMNRLTGMLNCVGAFDCSTTTRVTDLAITIVFRQEFCETVQTDWLLPAHADEGGGSGIAKRASATSIAARRILGNFIRGLLESARTHIWFSIRARENGRLGRDPSTPRYGRCKGVCRQRFGGKSW